MKAARQRTQFDHPESIAAPATPSCCCCSCCCLATTVSSTVMGAITAHHQAERVNRPSGWPIFFAILPLPAAVLAGAALGSATDNGVVALIGAAAAALTMWFLAFHVAAPEAQPSPIVRSFKYVFLFALLFFAELAIGFFLILAAVVPYFIVAGLVSFFSIRSHLKSQRAEVAATMPPPPAWQPPPPPPPGTPASRPTTMFSADQGLNPRGPTSDSSAAPAAWPPRSDYQSESPADALSSTSGPSAPTGSPTFQPPPSPPTASPLLGQPSFEPPTDYQLPGYPAAPPQAPIDPATTQPPPTYRPGNPDAETEPPPSDDEQA